MLLNNLIEHENKKENYNETVFIVGFNLNVKPLHPSFLQLEEKYFFVIHL